jgi:hypothetical protein
MSQPALEPDPVLRRASPLGDARGLAAGIAGTLRMARALAAAGRRIDLDGLQGPVGLLCAKSLDLPPEEGRRMRGVLIDLLREIDVLSATMRTEAGDDG